MPDPKETTQELTLLERSLEVFKTGGEILKKNQFRAEQATGVGNKILADIQEYRSHNPEGSPLSPELDERCQRYIVNCNKASGEMEESRKAVTQMMDIIKKEYTASENKLSPKTPGVPAFVIQEFRNAHAKWVHEEQKRKEKEAADIAKKSQEANSLKAESQKRIYEHFDRYLFKSKQEINDLFNSITLDNFDGRRASILGININYPHAHFMTFQHGLAGGYHTADEVNLIVKNATIDQFNKVADTFKAQMGELKDYLIDRLPSKKQELEKLANLEAERKRQEEEQARLQKEREQANEAERRRIDLERADLQRKQQESDREAARLKKEQEDREEQERQRQTQIDNENRALHEQSVNMSLLADNTSTLFDQAAAVSEDGPKPETRTGYDIKIINPAAWVLIFQYWFENEGKSMDNEKISKRSLAQMKAYCEGVALKNDIKIESKFLSYEPTFSAVNRKQK